MGWGLRALDASEYSKLFVKEMAGTGENCMVYDDKVLQLKKENAVCDSLARALLKTTKRHTGYFGCDQCEQNGVWLNVIHRMLFPEKHSPTNNKQGLLCEGYQGKFHQQLVIGWAITKKW